MTYAPFSVLLFHPNVHGSADDGTACQRSTGLFCFFGLFNPLLPIDYHLDGTIMITWLDGGLALLRRGCETAAVRDSTIRKGTLILADTERIP